MSKEQVCKATWEPMNNNGGCNFCTRENPDKMVWVIKSKDENRHLEVRFCEACMEEIKMDIGERTGTGY